MDILNVVDLVSDAERGAKLKLVDPYTNDYIVLNGEHVVITVLGAKAPALKPYANKLNSSERLSVRENAITDLLVAATMGWSNMTENGEEVPFTKDAVREVYKNPKMEWIAEQVLQFIVDLGNFKKDA